LHEDSSPLADRRHGMAFTSKIRLGTCMWLVHQSRETAHLSEVSPAFHVKPQSPYNTGFETSAIARQYQRIRSIWPPRHSRVTSCVLRAHDFQLCASTVKTSYRPNLEVDQWPQANGKRHTNAGILGVPASLRLFLYWNLPYASLQYRSRRLLLDYALSLPLKNSTQQMANSTVAEIILLHTMKE
jgi:hypothetical protein